MSAQATNLSDSLHGVEFFDPDQHSELPHELVRHLEFQDSPTSYILKITLEEFGSKKLPRGDKMAWRALLVFDGSLWYFHDWKNSSWSLKGPPDSASVREKLLKKVRQAARTVKQRLEAQAKLMIESGDFAIANQYSRLWSYFVQHRGEAEKLLSLEVGDEPSKLIYSETTAAGSKIEGFEMTSMNNYFARWRRSDAAAASAVILFFGLMEILFDACFAFGDRRGLTYIDFRSKEWKERFRLVVDIRQQPAERLYRELLHVQKQFRNVFTHALPTFFVLDKELGWIAAKTDDLTNPRMNPLYAFDREEVHSTFALFDEVIHFFENHETTWAATMYTKAPLLIPLADKRIAEIKRHANSRDAFEEEIERQIAFHEAFVNGEI